MISYRISSLLPLQLNEVAIGTGALCGAVYLDRRFEEFTIGRIGKERFEGMDYRARFQMVQFWETYVKREFVDYDDDLVEGKQEVVETEVEGEGEGKEFWVPVMGVPDDEERGIRDGFLKVTRWVLFLRVMVCAGVLFRQDADSVNHGRKDVREIFEPVVSQVLELISKQVIEVLKSGKGPVAVKPQPIAGGPFPPPASSSYELTLNNPQAILLVGGLGSSEYLYRRINKWGSGKITVMQPRNAWT